MNPVLLKPEADVRSQVVVQGRPWRTLAARDYYTRRDELWPVVTGALDRLRSEYELIIIEGAGSPAELNLQAADIVNMAIARYARAPVLLVGDIERGGVFAQLLGTLALLSGAERELVCGLVVNKFRGDLSLFDAGRAILEERSGLPVLGVVPWLFDLRLPEEDGEPLFQRKSRPASAGELDIAVIRLPRIANFDDFDPLAREPGVCLRYVDDASALGRPHAVILPGTKSTVADLAWLKESGLAEVIVRLAEDGTAVVGICGGYQMLGEKILDPDAVESTARETIGLQLLPVKTVFERSKATHQVSAVVEEDRHAPGSRGKRISGYEIHMGRSTGGRPWLRIDEQSGRADEAADGAVSDNGQIWGCYLHGLFGNANFRTAWLDSLGQRAGLPRRRAADECRQNPPPASDTLDAALDRLADGVEAALDIPRLEEIVWTAKERAACLPT
jgi:adenosylcobyric acid synthase